MSDLQVLELDDPEETIRGLIDVLVVQEQLWILVVESKRTSIPVPAALPQLLAYMLASPQSDRAVFGMATNADEFVFLKLSQVRRSFQSIASYNDHTGTVG